MSASSILKRHGYRQLKKIGEGSFGSAILVEAEASGAKQVCKMINVSQASPKEVQDTRKEAQLLAAFKHPFIVDYCANFLDSGYLCILMTFCEGGDLCSQVEIAKKAKRYLQEAQIVRWITQALLALKYIHDKHVLHRDLKTGNFFLSKAGNLKMGDFGIAKVLNSTQAVARTQIGTPYYLSPEVCQDKPYAWASDIWAMGVILYELCALKLPFDGGSNMIVLVQAIVRGTPAPMPEEYSESTRRLCLEMLSKSPGGRPSAGAILSRPDVQRIVQGFFQEAKQKAAQDAAGGEAASQQGTARGEGPLQVGDLMEYYSNTHKTWIPAVIIAVDGARITIDVKPNTWMSPEQQSQSLRWRGQQSRLPAPAAAAPSQADNLSTMQLEAMLEREMGSKAPTASSVPNSSPPTPLPPEPEVRRGKVGIDVPSVDAECDALLEELGLDDPPKAAAVTPVPELSQEEMDILNDSLLNGS